MSRLLVGVTPRGRFHISFPYRGEELARLARGFLADVDADAYPDLVEHVREHVDSDHTEVNGLEFGLDLLLDGLEPLREPS